MLFTDTKCDSNSNKTILTRREPVARQKMKGNESTSQRNLATSQPKAENTADTVSTGIGSPAFLFKQNNVFQQSTEMYSQSIS